MKTKLMSLGSIIIHVVVCCCLLAATTGCSNSKDSANAQATQHKAVRNKLSSGAKTLLTVGGTQSAPSGDGNTFEGYGDPASGGRTQGERKDTEQDKGKEALVRLVEGLEDQDAENVCKKIVSEKNSFTQKLALGMGFQGKKDKDAAKHLKKVIDRIINAEEEDSEKADKRREIIKVIVSNMYEESQSFKDNIDNIRKYVCNVTSGGEVKILTHKRDHSVGGKNINKDIESGTQKQRGQKDKKKYGELSSKKFGTYLPCILRCEEAKNQTVSAVESVLNRWIQDDKWQKKGKDDKQYFKSYNKENKAGGNKFTKEKPYTNLDQVIDDLNSRVNQEQ